MDWATQPDPFRRFVGAPLLDLELVPAGEQPRYEPAFFSGRIPPEPLGRRSISQLFRDSLALSAWKQAGGERWPLRVNPSSGNLHPTEGYLVAGPVAGLHDRAAVFHYAPREHALEQRAELPDETWAALARQLPPGSVLVGLTSIHWREAWKYGERAFRYCHHDVGHAIGAVTVAAAGLGWEARLCEGVVDTDLARLLGIDSQSGPEAEHADCLLAISHRSAPFSVDQQRAFTLALPPGALWPSEWHGAPNRLSPEHGQHWPVIDEVAEATRKLEPPAATFWQGGQLGGQPWPHRRRFAAGLAPDPAPAAERGRVRRPHVVSRAKRSFRSCSRPSLPRVRSRSRRCRGARASICCCSCIGSRAFRLAFTSCCAILAARRPCAD